MELRNRISCLDRERSAYLFGTGTHTRTLSSFQRCTKYESARDGRFCGQKSDCGSHSDRGDHSRTSDHVCDVLDRRDQEPEISVFENFGMAFRGRTMVALHCDSSRVFHVRRRCRLLSSGTRKRPFADTEEFAGGSISCHSSRSIHGSFYRRSRLSRSAFLGLSADCGNTDRDLIGYSTLCACPFSPVLSKFFHDDIAHCPQPDPYSS